MVAEKKWILSQKWLVISAIIGVLLILLGAFRETNEVQDEDLDIRVRAYTERLEGKIEEMLSELQGVGDVHVLVTLDGSSTFVYATDQKDNGTDYVILEQGDTQKPVLLQEVLSDIRGISVVCKNGDDPEIRRKIIGLLCTGFGIPSNRVFVAGSERKQA